jgi:hypothetical protein
MSFSRLILPALAAAFLTTASFAADAPPSSPPHGDHMGGAMSFLTPEERMMLFTQMRGETVGMTDEQRQAHREQQRAKFAAMSDAEKQKLAASLKAKWDALSPSQQDTIKQQMDAFRASHPRGPGGGQ